MKWDGEWQITYEVFRDLGIAFAVVLVLIYVLVVGWFQSFTMPLVIMLPIPLTLVGILPAHALLGAFFTATSMIGFIAGAGIIVRNSIILVDFIELRLRAGHAARSEAVIDAGAVRFRPMLLTAAAVVVGARRHPVRSDLPGAGDRLMAGEVAATLLSRMAVPVLYYLVAPRRELRRACAGEARRSERETDDGRAGVAALAGFFVMGSLALGYWVHPGFFLFTAFVGLNLFQSAFTKSAPRWRSSVDGSARVRPGRSAANGGLGPHPSGDSASGRPSLGREPGSRLPAQGHRASVAEGDVVVAARVDGPTAPLPGGSPGRDRSRR